MAVVPKCLKRFLLFGILPLVLAGGVIAWVERDELLCCYYLHRLQKAQGDEATRWAGKLASLGERVVPEVIALMAREDPDLCDCARATLCCLEHSWGREDPRCLEILHLAIKEFPRLSGCGQQTVLQMATDWLGAEGPCPDCLVSACSQLLGEVAHRGCPALHRPAVELALTVVTLAREADLVCAVRDLTRTTLVSTDATTRVRALKLAVQRGVDMRKDAVPLLNDPEPLVRRAAMLVVGEWPEVIHTDNLLNWLHDPDAEVRRLCEQSLQVKKRGNLSREYIRMGKLVTDPSWQIRVSVLDHLDEAEELDAAAWLRRLSHDPSAAVRAAAIRAASENSSVDLSDRLDQMAEDDPSPTVSSLARHYLQTRKGSE